uniref:non-specific serine/threonine protein kinase n=1 Tax=Amphiprion percula TaxID=161767 RepID=A0A3P8U8E3_AMPPE
MAQAPLDSVENAVENVTHQLLQTSISDTDYVTSLNTYCQKKKITVKPRESLCLVTFRKCCTFIVDGKTFPTGYGVSKKEAKEEAAKLACQNLGVTDQRQTNFIGIVNHYCQRTKRTLNFIEVERSGPPHNPQFTYKLVINNKDYPEGKGKNSIEAKQKAAQLAWAALQEQSDWDSKVSLRSTMSEDGAATMSSPTANLESIKASSQSLQRSTSESVALTDSWNTPKTQGSLRSAVSVDSPPSILSTPSSLESVEASSQSMQTSTSDSVLFTDSSHRSKDKDGIKNKNTENRQSETSAQSRFSSDFDSIECLAKGGFGHVFAAREKLVDKYYAVKIVRYKEKALREVTALGEISHDNIVRYYNCWIDDSEPEWDNATDTYSSSQSSSDLSPKYLYIKMELCDTKTLKDWINKKNEESLQETNRRAESLHLAQQIVSGVECIHSKKIIHRDLKPANIMFGKDGKVKIGDFGLATAETDDDNVKLMDRTDRAGTRSYMAPEQRSKGYGRKVDIFALGLIYFELLWKLSSGHERGKVLINARNRMLPEEFSPKFPQENQIILSMLSEKPENRPEASVLKTEMEKWTHSFTT